MKAALTAALCLIAVASARAGIKVERVDLDSASGPVFSATAHDVSLADAIAAFRKQTGIDVIYGLPRLPDTGGPVAVYDLDVKNLPREAALQELARALSLGLSLSNDGVARLMPGTSSGSDPRAVPTGLRITSVSRSQTLPASASGRRDGIEVHFSIADDPTDAATAKIKITEATDEQGRSLLSDVGENVAVEQPTMTVRRVSTLYAYLQSPSPPPARIAVLRGTAGLVRPKRVVRLTVDSFPDTALQTDLNGASISIGPLTIENDAVMLPMTVTRGDMDDDDWKSLRKRTEQLGDIGARGTRGVVLRGADGEVLQLQRRVSTNFSDTLTQTLAVVRPGRPTTAAVRGRPPVRPTMLQWDAVEDTSDAPALFEFRDVPLP